jgi:hypothetical protein
VAWTTTGSGGDTGDDDGGEAETHTATVEQRDLATTEEYDGSIGHGDAESLPGASAGTLTDAPATGATIGFGEVLFEVDGQPVVLLRGDVPAYRRLAYSEGGGEDVRQLEQHLTDGGFGDDGLVVDTEWTGDTTEAVQRWQDSLGLEQTGEVELGRVVFWPEPLRVDSVSADLGTQVQGSVLAVTGTDEVVTISVDADGRAQFEVDQVVDVELADGRVVEGTVTHVGELSSSGDGSDLGGGDGGDSSTATITIVIEGVDDAATGGSSVTVRRTLRTADDVLAVPVAALLALSEGGYAVEVVDGTADDGTPATRLVGVETGLFADGWVEVDAVDGELDAGDTVVVP